MEKNIRILEALRMQPLSDEEKEKRHILGRLYGPIATCTDSTRNGRRYNNELWEKALSDDVFIEKVNNKSLFLELGHPQDREETDMEKVCACIPEVPKIVDGDLYAYVDILDTPNGKLLKTLCDYGFVPGISSRGSGDIMPNDEVDPETFFLETWDIVQLPAVKKARLAVCESLAPQKDALTRALVEDFKGKTNKEKEAMKEALNNLQLGVDLTEARSKKVKKGKRDSSEFLPGGTPVDINDIPWGEMPRKSANVLTEDGEVIDILDDDDDLLAIEEPEEKDDVKGSKIDFDIVPAEESDAEDDVEEIEEPEDVEEKEEEDEDKEDSEEEFDVTTIKDLLNLFDDADEDAEVVFNPIIIGDKKYEDVEYSVNVDKDENKVYIDVICNDTESDSAEDKEVDADKEEQIKDEAEEIEADVEAEEEKIDSDKEETEDEAIDNGLDDVLENLKELVRSKELLETEIKSLRKSKAVSDTKVEKLAEELNRYKESFERTSAIAAKATELTKTVEKLTEAVNVKDGQLNDLRTKYAKATKINESLETKATENKQLNESLETARIGQRLIEIVQVGIALQKRLGNQILVFHFLPSFF